MDVSKILFRLGGKHTVKQTSKTKTTQLHALQPGPCVEIISQLENASSEESF